MTTQGEDQSGGPSSEAWRARVAADLLAYRAEQQQLWGGIDEVLRARYVSGMCTETERVRVEQAMRDFPAVRRSIEIAREITAEWEAAPSDVKAKVAVSRWQSWIDVFARLAALAAHPRLRLGVELSMASLLAIIMIFRFGGIAELARTLGIGAETKIGIAASSDKLTFPPLDTASRGLPPPSRQPEINSMALLFRGSKSKRLQH